MKKGVEKLCTWEQMVQMVTDKFITGSDASFLKKVGKTAKGGGLFNDVGNLLESKDKTVTLCVLAPFFFFMKSKTVMFTITKPDENVTYTMDSKKDWPKFYQGVLDAIEKEKNK